MRHRVTLQAPGETTEPVYGQVLPDWSSVGDYWAFVRPASGRERLVAGQVQAQLSHVVELRHLGAGVAITPGHRFLFGGRALNILAVLNVDERDRRYEVQCQEVAPIPEAS